MSFHLAGIVIHSHFLKNIAAFNQSAQAVNTIVDIVFDFVEITIVIICDLGQGISFANPLDIFGRYIQRSDYCIQVLFIPSITLRYSPGADSHLP
jgi:hypothetical protein